MDATVSEPRQSRVKIAVTKRRWVALRWKAAQQKRSMADVAGDAVAATLDGFVAEYEASHPQKN